MARKVNMPTPPPPAMTPLQVWDITQIYPYANGNGSAAATDVANNTNALINAIGAAAMAGGGIVYIPPAPAGYVVYNWNYCISELGLKAGIQIITPNIILMGAGGMGTAVSGSFSTTGLGASTLIGYGTGDTITIGTNQGGMAPPTVAGGCVVGDLAFEQYSGQDPPPVYQGPTDSFLRIQDAGDIRVKNVHMLLPNIGITLYLTTKTGQPLPDSQFWIEDLLIEGTMVAGGIMPVGGISATVGNATLHLNHIVMDIYQAPYSYLTQPKYGIQINSAGETIIGGGTDIIAMGECLSIRPTTGQIVVATYISDSLFDSGQGDNGTGCVVVAPSGTGFVLTMRFSNVWVSTGNNGLNGALTNAANGFMFVGSSTAMVSDISLVNCLAQSFAGFAGLYAIGLQDLAVTSSTFAGNYDGIHISGGMSNFIINGNKLGSYGLGGGNARYGIAVDAGSDFFIIVNNIGVNNGSGPRGVATPGGLYYTIANNQP